MKRKFNFKIGDKVRFVDMGEKGVYYEFEGRYEDVHTITSISDDNYGFCRLDGRGSGYQPHCFKLAGPRVNQKSGQREIY